MAERPSDRGRPGTGPGRESASRANRFDSHLPVVILWNGDELPCFAANFSRTGVFLSGRDVWPTGSSFTLIIKSSNGDIQIPVAVEVRRRTQASPAGASGLAVEFVGLDPDRREGIEFLVQRVIEGRSLGPELPEVPAGAAPHEIRRLLETVPLVQRVNLASRASQKERETLLHDQNGTVLEALARNSSLLPLEARALASSPHASGPALAALLPEGRFPGDEELAVLVLAHVKVPQPLIDRLVQSLKQPALRRALGKPGIGGLARAAIQKKLNLPR